MTGGDEVGVNDGLGYLIGFEGRDGDSVGGAEGYVDGEITGIMDEGFNEGFCVGTGGSVNRAGLRVTGC